MFKKSFSVFMATMMLVSVLSGCATSPSTSTGGSSSGAGGTAATVSNEVSFVFTKGGFEGVPDNDVIKQEFEKQSDVTLKHIAPPAANYVEKVNIILSGAEKDLPDLVKLQAVQFNDLFSYVDQGALMDLTELVKNAPSILKNIPQEALDRCTVDGKLYAIPVWCSPNRMNLIVRQDWLDRLKLNAPTTLDELHGVLTAFTKNDPDGNGKNDTYGYTGAGIEGLEPIFGAFGVSGMSLGFWYEENGELKSQATNPKAKEALKLLRQWYSEGLIDPEFVVIKNDSELNEKAMKNQFGMTYRWWTYESKIEQEMKKVDTNVSFGRIAPPKGADGTSGVRGVSLINGAVVMLKGAKNPEACMRLLDYYHTENGMMTAYTGVEGTHWEKRDGKYYTLPQFDQDQKWIQWYSALESEWPLLQVETPLVQSRRDTFNWETITNAGDGMLTEAERRYATDLTTLISDAYVKIITGKSDVDSFDKFVEEWESKGGAEWTKQINEIYSSRK